MSDFTSALYLGLTHPSAALPGWPALTLGRPAALREPCNADAVATELAQLQGAAAATLMPSTFHLFWDLLRMLARQARTAVLLDDCAYPILHWTAEGAAALGARVHRFSHYDASALSQLAWRAARDGFRPIVVCDGYCPGCNRPAPLRDYARIAANHGGMLALDDTQALGMLGQAPTRACPYGHGGGGSLRWHGLAGADIAVGASLAKAFGAPLAALSGSAALIARFRRESETRLHSSPPSIASVQAARAALMANAQSGTTWRGRLLRLVQRLRATLAQVALHAIGTLPFPVQSFVDRDCAGPTAVLRLHARLRAGGVRTLLTRGCQSATARLTLIVTAGHEAAQIDRVSALLLTHHLPRSRDEQVRNV